MKYALLGYAPLTTPDASAFGIELADAEMATTVRVRGGEVSLADGPYGGSSDELGVIWVIDVPDLDRALAVARRSPVAHLGAVEVRPVRRA